MSCNKCRGAKGSWLVEGDLYTWIECPVCSPVRSPASRSTEVAVPAPAPDRTLGTGGEDSQSAPSPVSSEPQQASGCRQIVEAQQAALVSLLGGLLRRGSILDDLLGPSLTRRDSQCQTGAQQKAVSPPCPQPSVDPGECKAG